MLNNRMGDINFTYHWAAKEAVGQLRRALAFNSKAEFMPGEQPSQAFDAAEAVSYWRMVINRLKADPFIFFMLRGFLLSPAIALISVVCSQFIRSDFWLAVAVNAGTAIALFGFDRKQTFGKFDNGSSTLIKIIQFIAYALYWQVNCITLWPLYYFLGHNIWAPLANQTLANALIWYWVCRYIFKDLGSIVSRIVPCSADETISLEAYCGNDQPIIAGQADFIAEANRIYEITDRVGQEFILDEEYGILPLHHGYGRIDDIQYTSKEKQLLDQWAGKIRELGLVNLHGNILVNHSTGKGFIIFGHEGEGKSTLSYKLLTCHPDLYQLISDEITSVSLNTEYPVAGNAYPLIWQNFEFKDDSGGRGSLHNGEINFYRSFVELEALFILEVVEGLALHDISITRCEPYAAFEKLAQRDHKFGSYAAMPVREALAKVPVFVIRIPNDPSAINLPRAGWVPGGCRGEGMARVSDAVHQLLSEGFSCEYPGTAEASDKPPHGCGAMKPGEFDTGNEYTQAADPRLAGFVEYVFNHLADQLESREIPAGEIIFEEGKKGNELYIIKNGRAKVTKHALPGFVGYACEGEIIGEMALLAPDSKRKATAVALEDMDVLVLTRARFNRLLKRMPQLQCVISALIHKRTVEFLDDYEHVLPSDEASVARFNYFLLYELRQAKERGEPAVGFMDSFSGKRIVDIGCGKTAPLVRWLLNNGFNNVLGVDPGLAIDKPYLIRQDASSMEAIADNSVDLVVLSAFLDADTWYLYPHGKFSHEGEFFQAAAAEIDRILKPGAEIWMHPAYHLTTEILEQCGYQINDISFSVANSLGFRIATKPQQTRIPAPEEIFLANEVKVCRKLNQAEKPAWGTSQNSGHWIKQRPILQIMLKDYAPLDAEQSVFSCVTADIPRIAQLGIGTIWLTGVAENENGQTPFTILDPKAVDKHFGTLQELEGLLRVAHEHGLKIITDFVGNHVSEKSRLCVQHPDWFIKDKKGAFQSATDSVAGGWVWKGLVQCDFLNAELIDYLLSVAEFWLKLGFDGFRLDAPVALLKRRMKENWYKGREEEVDFAFRQEFWARFMERCRRINPDAGFLAEAFDEGRTELEECGADLTLDLGLSFILFYILKGSAEPQTFSDYLESNASSGYFYSKVHYKDGHDIRDVYFQGSGMEILRNFNAEEAKIVALLMATLPGIPMFYNGELEAVLGYAYHSSCGKPICWDDYDPPMREFYGEVMKLARDPVFRMGSFKVLDVKAGDNPGITAFLREYGSEQVIVAANLNPKNNDSEEKDWINLNLNGVLGNDAQYYYPEDILSGETFAAVHRAVINEHGFPVGLRPGEVQILKILPCSVRETKTAPFAQLIGNLSGPQAQPQGTPRPDEADELPDNKGFFGNLTQELIQWLRDGLSQGYSFAVPILRFDRLGIEIDNKPVNFYEIGDFHSRAPPYDLPMVYGFATDPQHIYLTSAAKSLLLNIRSDEIVGNAIVGHEIAELDGKSHRQAIKEQAKIPGYEQIKLLLELLQSEYEIRGIGQQYHYSQASEAIVFIMSYWPEDLRYISALESLLRLLKGYNPGVRFFDGGGIASDRVRLRREAWRALCRIAAQGYEPAIDALAMIARIPRYIYSKPGLTAEAKATRIFTYLSLVKELFHDPAAGIIVRTTLKKLLQSSPAAKDGFEHFIHEYIFGKIKGKKSNIIFLNSRWYSGEYRILAQKMPTLFKGIFTHRDRAERICRLLQVLALLSTKEMFYYEDSNKKPMPPIAYAKESGIQFRLGEVFIVPLSESFRRHIFYTEDEDGEIFAIEIKIPGEDDGRQYIQPQHFTLTKKLWDMAPQDPGILKPLFFMTLAGRLRLYKNTYNFPDYAPLGIAGFSHVVDGKRLSNLSSLQRWEIAVRRGWDLKKLRINMLLNVLAVVIRVHALGYLIDGITSDGALSPDLHAENVTLTMRGKTLLPADFGVARINEGMGRNQGTDETENYYETRRAINMISRYWKRLGEHFTDASFIRLVRLLVRPVVDIRMRARLALQALDDFAKGDYIYGTGSNVYSFRNTLRGIVKLGDGFNDKDALAVRREPEKSILEAVVNCPRDEGEAQKSNPASEMAKLMSALPFALPFSQLLPKGDWGVLNIPWANALFSQYFEFTPFANMVINLLVTYVAISILFRILSAILYHFGFRERTSRVLRFLSWFINPFRRLQKWSFYLLRTEARKIIKKLITRATGLMVGAGMLHSMKAVFTQVNTSFSSIVGMLSINPFLYYELSSEESESSSAPKEELTQLIWGKSTDELLADKGFIAQFKWPILKAWINYLDIKHIAVIARDLWLAGVLRNSPEQRLNLFRALVSSYLQKRPLILSDELAALVSQEGFDLEKINKEQIDSELTWDLLADNWAMLKCLRENLLSAGIIGERHWELLGAMVINDLLSQKERQQAIVRRLLDVPWEDIFADRARWKEHQKLLGQKLIETTLSDNAFGLEFGIRSIVFILHKIMGQDKELLSRISRDLAQPAVDTLMSYPDFCRLNSTALGEQWKNMLHDFTVLSLLNDAQLDAVFEESVSNFFGDTPRLRRFMIEEGNFLKVLDYYSDYLIYRMVHFISSESAQKLRELLDIAEAVFEFADIALKFFMGIGLRVREDGSIERYPLSTMIFPKTEDMDIAIELAEGVFLGKGHLIGFLNEIRDFASGLPSRVMAVDILKSVRGIMGVIQPRLKWSDEENWEVEDGFIIGEARGTSKGDCLVIFTPTAKRVLSDSRALRHVWLNTVTNCVQSMGYVPEEVSVREGVVVVETDYDESNAVLVVRIRDSGPGIPKSIRDSFSGRGRSKSSKAHGTGTGTRDIIRFILSLGGTVDFITPALNEMPEVQDYRKKKGEDLLANLISRLAEEWKKYLESTIAQPEEGRIENEQPQKAHSQPVALENFKLLKNTAQVQTLFSMIYSGKIQDITAISALLNALDYEAQQLLLGKVVNAFCPEVFSLLPGELFMRVAAYLDKEKVSEIVRFNPQFLRDNRKFLSIYQVTEVVQSLPYEFVADEDVVYMDIQQVLKGVVADEDFVKRVGRYLTPPQAAYLVTAPEMKGNFDRLRVLFESLSFAGLKAAFAPHQLSEEVKKKFSFFGALVGHRREIQGQNIRMEDILGLNVDQLSGVSPKLSERQLRKLIEICGITPGLSAEIVGLIVDLLSGVTFSLSDQQLKKFAQMYGIDAGLSDTDKLKELAGKFKVVELRAIVSGLAQDSERKCDMLMEMLPEPIRLALHLGTEVLIRLPVIKPSPFPELMNEIGRIAPEKIRPTLLAKSVLRFIFIFISTAAFWMAVAFAGFSWIDKGVPSLLAIIVIAVFVGGTVFSLFGFAVMSSKLAVSEEWRKMDFYARISLAVREIAEEAAKAGDAELIEQINCIKDIVRQGTSLGYLRPSSANPYCAAISIAGWATESKFFLKLLIIHEARYLLQFKQGRHRVNAAYAMDSLDAYLYELRPGTMMFIFFTFLAVPIYAPLNAWQYLKEKISAFKFRKPTLNDYAGRVVGSEDLAQVKNYRVSKQVTEAAREFIQILEAEKEEFRLLGVEDFAFCGIYDTVAEDLTGNDSIRLHLVYRGEANYYPLEQIMHSIRAYLSAKYNLDIRLTLARQDLYETQVLTMLYPGTLFITWLGREQFLKIICDQYEKAMRLESKAAVSVKQEAPEKIEFAPTHRRQNVYMEALGKWREFIYEKVNGGNPTFIETFDALILEMGFDDRPNVYRHMIIFLYKYMIGNTDPVFMPDFDLVKEELINNVEGYSLDGKELNHEKIFGEIIALWQEYQTVPDDTSDPEAKRFRKLVGPITRILEDDPIIEQLLMVLDRLLPRNPLLPMPLILFGMPFAHAPPLWLGIILLIAVIGYMLWPKIFGSKRPMPFIQQGVSYPDNFDVEILDLVPTLEEKGSISFVLRSSTRTLKLCKRDYDSIDDVVDVARGGRQTWGHKDVCKSLGIPYEEG
ncbi:MAG: alpha-amylase family glycosyl hydrolase, partial [Candidatus Omnitrophota bacterium]